MGTDIHFFTEKRAHPGASWKLFVLVHDCDYCDGLGYFEALACPVCKGTGQEKGYRKPNYRLFAMLAGVRNGGGTRHAGARFQPIAPQRGLPDDISEELRAIFDVKNTPDGTLYEELHDQYGAAPGDHSASYVTLEELLAYDLGRTIKTEDGRVQTYRETAGGWFEKYIPLLAEHGEPENVRCVFNFDC